VKEEVMNMEDKDDIKKMVRNQYSKVATQGTCCCGSPPKQKAGADDKNASCCPGPADPASKQIGYSDAELQELPDGADLGLGCGNPVALASLKEGDTFLDLGSGAGIDCFLAAKKVGPTGKVIGVDMTPAMLDKARGNAESGGYTNVEFRLGEIEHMPVSDDSIDVITSNCVINLSPDKPSVFQEAYRVLKPGGRIMISDIVLVGELPEELLKSAQAYAGCISGAMQKDEYLELVRKAGFSQIEIMKETGVPLEAWASEFGIPADELKKYSDTIISLNFSATKP
jgi:SAM-dependent methyltransferase